MSGALCLPRPLPTTIAPFSPTKMGAGAKLLEPSWTHLAGTDEFGRDMFSRIVFGARLTLVIGAIAVGISVMIGLTIGLVAPMRAASSRRY